MKNVNKYFLGILTVCLVSAIFLFMSIEALQTIYLGEANLSGEWNIVRVSYLINGLLYLFIVITFLKFRRQLKNSN